MMQKVLATNGTCIIVAGDGDFQKSLIIYKAMTKDHCIQQVCSV